MPPTTFLMQLLVTCVILGVILYVATEVIQKAFYEFVIEKLGWRVMIVTPILATALVKWPLLFDKLLFNLSTLLVHGVLWFIACWLGLRFQWPHALGAGLLAVLLIGPIASSAVDSLIKPGSAAGVPSAPVPAGLPESATVP